MDNVYLITHTDKFTNLTELKIYALMYSESSDNYKEPYQLIDFGKDNIRYRTYSSPTAFEDRLDILKDKNLIQDWIKVKVTM